MLKLTLLNKNMKKYITNFSILVSSIIFSIALIGVAIHTAAAQSATPSDAFSKLTYPIAELGGCTARDNCKIYCDDSANTEACISYAEKKSLMSGEELQVAKKFVAGGAKGPGSCKGKKECQTYCEDKNNIDECVSYAENNGLMKGEDLQKAKKVQAAIKKGVKFPSCSNKKECDNYCEDVNHMAECITFAKEAGFLNETESQNSDKVLSAVKKGVRPPACKGKEACDTYCADASHADECVNFAIAAGIVTSDEARIIKETGGKGPGGCKGKEECNSYCSNEANKESCMSFAKEHNIPQPQPFDSVRQNSPQATQGKQDGTVQPGSLQAGPGNGAGQGGGTPGVTPQKPTTPTKCIAECETNGKNCISALGAENKRCLSIGQNCREVTCETKDAEGNRSTGEVMRACSNDVCVPLEKECNDKVTVQDSACRTTKDVCVMNCQKASKPTKPAQPATPSTKPEQPPTPPTKPTQPTQPPQSSTGSQLTPPAQPTIGYCGDGKCGKMELANPKLCPQDCGGIAPTQSTQPD